MIFVDTHGENVRAICPGANATMGVAQAGGRRARPRTRADILVEQQEVPQAPGPRAAPEKKPREIVSISTRRPPADDEGTPPKLASIVVANEKREFEAARRRGAEDDVIRRWAIDHGKPQGDARGREGAWGSDHT